MNRPLRSSVATLLALVALPAILAAQEHLATHAHYTLVDLGTLGGPNSWVAFTVTPMNSAATVVGIADTPVHDPFDPYCFMDCSVAHAFQWRRGVLTDLGALTEGASSGPNAINAAGVVAGISETGAIDPQSEFPPEFDAVVWKDGQITDLGTFGGTFSYANAINNRSQVVGLALDAVPHLFTLDECGAGIPTTTQARAFIWQERGGLEELGTLGGSDSCALVINQRGQVAGHSFTNFTPNLVTGVPTDDPFLWEDGEMRDLGTLGGTQGHPNGINDRGQVCGSSNLAGDLTTHAFFWDRGQMKDLGTLGGTFSIAQALNENGEVVGGAMTTDDQAFNGFLGRHGAMTDLGSVAGYGCSIASSINSSGQVVGQSFECLGEASHAFLWEKGGPAIDLNTLVPSDSGLTLIDATLIGDGGEITGQGVLANGDEHAFLLIPNAAGAAVATTAGLGPETKTPTRINHAKLTPENIATLRARFANRHHGVGLRPSTKVN